MCGESEIFPEVSIPEITSEGGVLLQTESPDGDKNRPQR
jgi:hypothetical protein